MAIPRDTIEHIRHKAAIEDIIKRYVPTLAKKGKNYVGLCPFHKETSPSFTVSPDKQMFYCFGCHEGGNVFTFISKVERVDFAESVKIVGEIVGIPVREEKNFRDDEYGRLLKINEIIAQSYRQALRKPENKNALEYLLNRGVTQQSIEEFALGYAPDQWRYVTDTLKKMNIVLDTAVKTGNINKVVKNGEIHYYDRFRGRVIFPIFGQKNEIIGFGGRIIAQGDPKYLNSPESPVFQKRNILYGLNKSRQHIAELGRAIVVEGYLDVIGVYQAGIQNVVAPLGTALTLEQLQLLSRLCTEVVIVFDADSAGIKASLRSLDVAQNLNIDIRIAQLPELDPFDFVKKHGMREFMAIVDSALKPVDFRIERVIQEQKGRQVDILKHILPILRDISSEVERQTYFKKLSTMFQIPEQAIRADYERFVKGHKLNGRAIVTENSSLDFYAKSQRELVLLLCNYPELIEHAVVDCSPSQFTDDVAKNIYQVIIDLYERNEPITLEKLFDFYPEGQEAKLLAQGFSKQFAFEDPKIAYSEILLNMRLYTIDKKINEFVEKIRKNEQENTQYYMTEIEVLRREREKLASYIYNKSSAKI
ncbi:MAG: DNA primase [Spirochaetes bacterium]|nr:DNA primase [Spirochaetota bacterium]